MRNNPNLGFARRMKLLRGTLSQADIARKIGVSAPLYNQWENGQVPTVEKVLLISSTFNVSAQWLILGQQVIEAAEESRFSSADRVLITIGAIEEILRQQVESTEALRRITARIEKFNAEMSHAN